MLISSKNSVQFYIFHFFLFFFNDFNRFIIFFRKLIMSFKVGGVPPNSSSDNMYRVGDYVYFENSASGTYAVRRIEELNKTANGKFS